MLLEDIIMYIALIGLPFVLIIITLVCTVVIKLKEYSVDRQEKQVHLPLPEPKPYVYEIKCSYCGTVYYDMHIQTCKQCRAPILRSNT